MRLDPELVRALLLEVEGRPAGQRVATPAPPGLDQQVVYSHLQEMRDAGLIVAHVLPSSMHPNQIYAVAIERITPAGREFLEAARDDKRWRVAKTKAIEIGTSAAGSAAWSGIAELVRFLLHRS